MFVKHLKVPRVKCGVCQAEMTKRQWETTHMEKHNYVSWLEGEKALDATKEVDLIAADYRARRILKKLYKGLRCEKCGVRKRSGVGYYSHIQMCGLTDTEREAIKVQCSICGRSMLPCSLKIHMGSEHKEGAEDVKPPEPPPELTRHTQRAAAAKAVSRLEEVLADEIQEEPKPKKNTIKVRRLYTKTLSRLFPSAYVKWKLELKENGFMTCILPGCPFVADNTEEIRAHYYTCPIAVRAFVCKVCDTKCKTENDIRNHVMTAHQSSLTADQDFELNSNSGNSDEDDNEPEIEETEIEEHPKLNLEKPQFVKRAYQKDLYFICKRTLNDSYERLVDNTPDEPLFQDFIPLPLDEVLSEKDAKEYLPSTKTSINFSVESGNRKQLEYCKSCKFGDSKLMFVGGPVWAIAWCPVSNDEKQQFLAVACHPDMNKYHSLGAVHSYSSMIQIWDCGVLDNLNQESSDSLPTLKLGLAHTNGAVWAMEWCPAGCYQPSSGRLGLLAAGFSSGNVSLYSIPYKQINATRLPIVKMKPVLQLELMNEEPAQCTRLAWSNNLPFNILACGYSDGLIALFDLTSQSPLLRSENTLYPFHMFQAHSKSITGLEFLPIGGNSYLMTAALSRDVKYWNLSDTSGPISVSRLNRITNMNDVVWLKNWVCAASVSDDGLGYGIMSVTLNNFRDYVYNTLSLMSQNCLSWSVSSNDWTNSVALTTECGDIIAMQCRQLYWLEEKSQRRTKKFLTKTELRRLDGKESDPNIKLNIPETYEEAAEHYELVLKNETIPTTTATAREEPVKHYYPITSINKGKWNPNCQSFLYFAAGYHCGFVHILRDKTMDEYKVLFQMLYDRLQSDSNG